MISLLEEEKEKKFSSSGEDESTVGLDANGSQGSSSSLLQSTTTTTTTSLNDTNNNNGSSSSATDLTNNNNNNNNDGDASPGGSDTTMTLDQLFPSGNSSSGLNSTTTTKKKKKRGQHSNLFALTVAPNYDKSLEKYKPLIQVDPSLELFSKYKSQSVADDSSNNGTTDTTSTGVLSTDTANTTLSKNMIPLEIVEQAKVIPGLFLEGFLEYYQSGLFTDATVICCSKEYRVHKLIVCYRSGYFRRVFSTDPTVQVHTIDDKAPSMDLCNLDEVFPFVIDFLYTGKIEITQFNVVSLKLIANLLDISPLKCEVENFLVAYVNEENVFDILNSAIQSNDSAIKNICVDSIAFHFDTLYGKFVDKVFKTSCDDTSQKIPLDIFFAVIGNKNMKSNVNELRVKIVSNIVEQFIKEFNAMENIELFKQMINAATESKSLDLNLAIKYLKYCDTRGEELHEQSVRCSQSLAFNFHFLLTSPSSNIIYEILPSSFVELLKYDELYIKDEDQVYDIACKYVEHNKDTLTEDQKKEIFKCVRYTYLSVQLLTKLKQDPLFISKEDILEALWARVGRLEGKKVDESIYSLRPRKNRVFIYEKDFDTNGILYWLGCNYNQETYMNPIDRGLVTVSVTANYEVGKAQDLISHEPAKCNLVGKANTQINIKFETLKIMPTKYTLRHTMSRDGEALRYWTLSASVDGVTYVDLIVHNNDTTLNLKGSTGSWDIEANGNYYQYFRITQTGNNSSNNNYLSMAGLEMYGLVHRICEE
ncbi:hypothetical protein FDP41_013112 [Naegleria fowleri]|uniref:BTB domain-containing protein n=1 Tax=Naegleria fowleri TaxID=5763 RepID=A0A6A5C5M8_NAEFO|nr:uncharacterized protein FDP41_013112 [Naegleria fowleri]KAF0980629.1 hypothetical protein FDP41_013112 [Naegleria fowleri]